MYKRILDTIKRYSMFEGCRHVKAALSGGADSVFLLYFLNSIREEFGFRLSALHVNHKLRGKDADADAAFCEDICNKLDVPFDLYEEDVASIAREKGMSLEEAGRFVRMDLFKKLAGQEEGLRIAAGHNADDQAETLLMRILSGTGIRGLAGIYPVYENYLIRPLVELRKAEIIGYLEGEAIPYHTDDSNFDKSFTRNRIRQELLPYIRENFNPDVDGALLRLADAAMEENLFIKKAAVPLIKEMVSVDESGVVIDLNRNLSINVVLLKEILREAVLLKTGSLQNISALHWDNLAKLADSETGAKTELPGGITAEMSYGKMIFRDSDEDEVLSPNEAVLEFPGVCVPDEWGIRIEGTLGNKVPETFPKSADSAFFDADALGGLKLTLRGRREGDLFHPFGMKNPVSLKDFLIKAKIPRRRRPFVPLICSGEDIIWAAGIRAGEKFRIREGTKRVLTLRIEPLQP